MIAFCTSQMQRCSSFGVGCVGIRVVVVEQGDDRGVFLMPDRCQERIVYIPVGVVVLQSSCLQVAHYRVHAGQILEAFFDVALLPYFLLNVTRLVDDVLRVHRDSLCTALAGYAFAVLLLVDIVVIVLRLFPLYVVLLVMVGEIF